MPELTVQKLILKTLLSLPTPILRLMAGGGVVYKGGATLDPCFQFLAHQARTAPPMSSVTALEARAGAKAGFAMVASAPEVPGAPCIAATPVQRGSMLDLTKVMPAQ